MVNGILQYLNAGFGVYGQLLRHLSQSRIHRCIVRLCTSNLQHRDALWQIQGNFAIVYITQDPRAVGQDSTGVPVFPLCAGTHMEYRLAFKIFGLWGDGVRIAGKDICVVNGDVSHSFDPGIAVGGFADDPGFAAVLRGGVLDKDHTVGNGNGAVAAFIPVANPHAVIASNCEHTA